MYMYNHTEYCRKYYHKHRKRLLKQKKQYHKKNAKRRCKWNREYRSRNRDKVKAYNIAYYAEHKEELLPMQRIRNKKNYRENRQAYTSRHWERVWRNSSVIQAIKNVPCKDCKKEGPPYVMQFDHLGDKKYEIKQMVFGGHSLANIFKEIAKCEVVCANCHAIRTHKRNQYSNPSKRKTLTRWGPLRPQQSKN